MEGKKERCNGCKCDKVLISLSAAASVFAGIVFLWNIKEGIFGLAGTQWVLVAIVLAVYALYAHIACPCKAGCSTCFSKKSEFEKK